MSGGDHPHRPHGPAGDQPQDPLAAARAHAPGAGASGAPPRAPAIPVVPSDDDDPFWQRLRAGLAAEVAPPPPARDPAGLASGVLRRWRLEPGPQRAPQGRRAWLVLQLGGLAAAACVGVLVGWLLHAPAAPSTATSPTPVAWFEDGGPAFAPPSDVGWASYMPRGQGPDGEQVERVQPAGADRPHPWLGIWTRPVQQLSSDGSGHPAHLVVRVAGGSPAWEAGLRPGDILTGLDGCSLATPECIGAHLSGLAPGALIAVSWWDVHQARARQASIRLDAIHE
jgi:hypothetical protein